MECEICGCRAPEDGATLFRVNSSGVPGLWRCREHLTDEQRAAIAPEVKEITDIIEMDNRQKEGLA